MTDAGGAVTAELIDNNAAGAGYAFGIAKRHLVLERCAVSINPLGRDAAVYVYFALSTSGNPTRITGDSGRMVILERAISRKANSC